MQMRLRLALVLGLAAGPGAGETPVPCAGIPAALRDLSGLTVSAPPAAMAGGWCVLDGARLTGAGVPTVAAGKLRARAGAEGAEVVSLEVGGQGLRLAPGLQEREVPEWLRDLLRLQSADLRLALRRDSGVDRLLIDEARLDLSGGSALRLSAEASGAGLTARDLPFGRLHRLRLDWRSDGRSLRPALTALGAAVQPEAEGDAAVEAARGALLALVAALPEAALAEAGRTELEAAVRALPQGRGRLVAELVAERGIGAAELGLLALSRDPGGPEALARLLAGSQLEIDWQPGLVP